ncbi:dihydropteroate synthase [Pseudohoeflea sp. DP4N28-3]|uniref:dihydropteroate synthase n=2 Tax=Pseudohoeflea coraliihabitans TaxID=2860393 RepID=A0ABS6WQ15_9HYPH|nr:dihydropteroate synthase [Pseudohoeflea sp. DP4N28-3]
MGIVNVTPDSFSDGGRLATPDAAIAAAREMVKAGAKIIDIGGESTRPGADPVSAAEEQRRVLPVIEALAGQDDVLLSIDTYRADTAQKALTAGAAIINDVWGAQKDPEIAAVAAEAGAGLVLMHNGRDRQKLADPIDDQFAWFDRSLEIAAGAGLDQRHILLDPGFGFAKDVNENLEVMAGFAALHRYGLPLVAGTSRKRFIGAVTGEEVAANRDVGTAASSVVLRLAGAAVFRVHATAINRQALQMADAVIAAHLARSGGEGENNV